MKAKKFSLFILAMFSVFLIFLFDGQNSNSVQASSTTQLVKKINKVNKKALRSYRIKQKMNFTVNGKTINMNQTLITNAHTAKVTATENDKKSVAWISGNYEYVKSGKHWYKVRLKAGLNKANAVGKSLKGSANVITANKEFIKSVNVAKSGNNYVLTLQNNPAANSAVMNTMVQAYQGMGLGMQVVNAAKNLKINNFQTTEKVNRHNLKINKVTANMTMTMGNSINCNTNSVMDHLGKYSHLRVPKKITKHAIRV